MKLEPHGLERWLSTHSAEYDLAGGTVRALDMGDLIKDVDLRAEYGDTRGSEELREEICELYSQVDKGNVLVTNGTAEANFLVTNRLLDEGDEVIIQVPSYQQVWGVARAIGARVYPFHLVGEEGYKPDVEELKNLVSKETKAIFVINPNNPTGAILSEGESRAICEVAEDVGAYVVCDEILRGTEVDGVMTPSIVDLYERGICTMSLSKLGLAGLRIGWIVADEETVEGCWSYKDYTSLSHSSLTERLAIIALQRGNFEKILDRARGIIRRNLKVFSEWMRRHDHALSWVEPRAGATAFPEYGLNIDSYEFCERLLREENLLLSPGDLFQFPRHIRIRYAGHDGETLTKALERLHAFLERHA